jgi:hypothetical protein
MDEWPDALVNQPRGIEAASEERPAPHVPPRTRIAERICCAINRNAAATLAFLITFYLVIACAQAATKLLWTDELITLAIARQGSFQGIWRALAAGADPNPPLTHWLVLESTRAFGQSALAIRLPAILCVLLAIVCLWAILRRWVEPAYAAVGILAFMATRGFDYAYDARSYAPLMGFAMASLALWLIACDHAETPRDWPPQNLARIAALTGMGAALALGLSSNYYGVLAFFPIAVGEILRTARLRRLEPGTWLAMAAGALPLLAFRPLIRHNLAEFVPHAWNRAHLEMISSSYLELVEGVFWPVLGLALYSAWRHRRARTGEPRQGSSLQPHESIALVVLLLYPILGYLIALAGHGMISPRCVVPVCCGFGIATALLARRVFASSSGVILLGIALVWVTARESSCALVLAQQRAAFFALRDDVARMPYTQPILVADSLFVLPLAHYSGKGVRSRIVFPIDFDAIHAYERDDSGEQNLWAGRDGGLFPMRIVPNAPSTSPTLTVIARPTGWLAHTLAAEGFHLDESSPDPAWQNLGGVFTPMAHEDTRLLTARR